MGRTPDYAEKTKANTDANSVSLLSNSRRDVSSESFKKTLDATEKRSASPEPRMALNKKEGRETETVKKAENRESSPKAQVRVASAREKAVLEFMDSIESEFGIPPSRLVGVLTEVQPEANDSIIEASSQIADNLQDEFGLSDEDQAKIAALYAGLFKQLESVEPTDIKAMSQAQSEAMPLAMATAAGAGFASEKVSLKDRRQTLNDSLDQMNSKFFMQDPHSQRNGHRTYQNMQQEFDKPMLMKDSFSKGMTQPVDANALDMNIESQLNKDMMFEGNSLQMAEESMATPTGMHSGAAANKALDPSISTKLAELNSSAESLDMSLLQSSMAEALEQQNLSQSGGEQFSSDMGQETERNSTDLRSSDPEGFEQLMNSAPGQAGLATGAAGSMAKSSATGAAMADVEGEQNIQQLMNQTEYMIKKGGGEAKITLDPEGLGKVHLRVLVNSGAVDVQMQAENNAAKKLLESHLNDLKHSLQVRNLNLEGIKVEVGSQANNETNKDSSQQQMNSQGDAQREHAQKFLGQFRDENFARRDGGFMDNPRLKSYQSSARGVTPLDPAPVEASAKRYQAVGKGGSVDRVA